MSQSRERINEALDLAAAGAIEDACERLWPLMREDQGREEALFTMACCFERANQLPPAAYLFGWVAERYPDFTPAIERRDRCRRLMAERGLHEDFGDSGHVSCSACTLRYRAELPSCPYCGGEILAGEPVIGTVPALPPEPQSRDVFDQIGRDLDRAWKNVQERFKSLSERQDLSGAALRVQELAREVKTRAQSFAESEKVKKVARQTRELSDEAISRVKEFARREDVKDAQERVADLGRETADRVEGWTHDERIRSTARSLYNAVDKFLSGIQQRLDRITGRKEPDSPADAPSDEGDTPRT